MGGKPIRLICTWHVNRAWQEELCTKGKDAQVAAEIYKMLQSVLLTVLFLNWAGC